jgi:GNAT superfamily N-acetyltransferase
MSSPQSATSLGDAPGIVIRRAAPCDAEAIARVRIDGWRTSYRGLIPAAYLDGMQVDASTALWDKILTAGPGAASVFVATHGDEVVGFAAGSMLAEPKFGLNAELTAVYLRREFQRVGLGRRLIAAVVDAQRALGAAGMIVWVIAANKPARTFYEALGAELLVEQAFQWDGMDLLEAGYGWRDLEALAAACRAGQTLPETELPKEDRRAG